MCNFSADRSQIQTEVGLQEFAPPTSIGAYVPLRSHGEIFVRLLKAFVERSVVGQKVRIRYGSTRQRGDTQFSLEWILELIGISSSRWNVRQSCVPRPESNARARWTSLSFPDSNALSAACITSRGEVRCRAHGRRRYTWPLWPPTKTRYTTRQVLPLAPPPHEET